MNVLMISLVYWPDTTGNGPIMTDLAESLAASGHDVTVVCGFPHYGRDEAPEEYSGRFTMVEKRHGVRIIRAYQAGAGSSSPLQKMLGYLVFTLTAIIAGLKAGPVDVILAPSPPLSIGISAWLVGIVRRAPFVYIVQDLFPEAYIKLDAITSPVAIQFFRWMAGFVYRKAHRIVCVMETMAEVVAEYGIPEDRIVVIPNWADTSEIEPCARANKFAVEQGLNGDFVVQYAGNIGASQRLDLVVECAQQLEDENVQFVIIGSGTMKEQLREDITSRGLSNVRLLDTQPRERLSEVLGACDVALVPLREGMSATSFPSKIYSIMASARPMIAALDEASSPRRFVEKHQCGLTIDPDEPSQLLAAIRTLKRDSARRESMAHNARRSMEELDLKTEALEAYRRLLADMVEER